MTSFHTITCHGKLIQIESSKGIIGLLCKSIRHISDPESKGSSFVSSHSKKRKNHSNNCYDGFGIKWYILPIGWLYITYRLLREPETAIDWDLILNLGPWVFRELGWLPPGFYEVPNNWMISGVIALPSWTIHYYGQITQDHHTIVLLTLDNWNGIPLHWHHVIPKISWISGTWTWCFHDINVDNGSPKPSNVRNKKFQRTKGDFWDFMGD